jgi:hypothetical protein
VVLRLVRRRTGPVLRSWKAVVSTALVIAAAGTFVGVVGVVASAAYDYRLQTNLIDFEQSFENVQGIPLVTAGSTVARGNCNSMICNEERFSLATDMRGAMISAPVLLVGNILLVGLLLAYFGGRLGAPQRRRTKPATSVATGPADPTAETVVVPESSGEKV